MVEGKHRKQRLAMIGKVNKSLEPKKGSIDDYPPLQNLKKKKKEFM